MDPINNDPSDFYLMLDEHFTFNEIEGVEPIHLTATMILKMAAYDTDAIWRVEEFSNGSAQSMYIGLSPIDSERIINYKTVSEIPEWINDRIAVLRMLPCDPTNSVVFGVGRRISEHVFWVVEGTK